MLPEKVTALIKSLPKQQRRNYVPAPDYAQQVAPLLNAERHLPLKEALVNGLKKLNSTTLVATDFQDENLSRYLQMRYEILDSNGQCIDEGRQLELLQKKYIDQIEESLAGTAENSFERSDFNDWNFGDLPESVEIETQGVKMQGYPALVDEQGKVALRLFATKEAAVAEMRAGLRMLYKKVMQKEVKYLLRNLPGIDVLCLRFAVFGKSAVLKHDIIDAAIDATFIDSEDQPRSREEFLKVIDQNNTDLVNNANAICAVLEKTMEAHRTVAKRLSGSVSLSWVEPMGDIQDQIAQLIYPGFVTATPAVRLARLPVYFNAINKRLDSLDREPDRDRRRRAELLPVWEQVKQACENTANPNRNKIIDIRWLFEELRVSIFAQELGAADKVSVPRIESLLKKHG